MLLVQTQAARSKAATTEQLTGAHLYLDIAKSGYHFHGFSGGMSLKCDALVRLALSFRHSFSASLRTRFTPLTSRFSRIIWMARRNRSKLKGPWWLFVLPGILPVRQHVWGDAWPSDIPPCRHHSFRFSSNFTFPWLHCWHCWSLFATGVSWQTRMVGRLCQNSAHRPWSNWNRLRYGLNQSHHRKMLTT